MGNISIKLNLQQLKHVEREMTGKDGEKVKCLIIPIKENNLFEGEKGTYLDLQAFELKNPKPDSKDTHLVKQSLPKDLYDTMSEEERKAIPIMGNAIQWGSYEAEPNQSDALSQSAVDQYEEKDDGLPF